MKVYRIERRKYAEQWPPVGALYGQGRWNARGFWIVYCSTSVALAKLETLANSAQLPIDRVLLEITIAAEAPIYHVTAEELPQDWMRVPYSTHLHEFTERLLKDNQYIGLQVPSRQSPTEYNVLLYPPHPNFQALVQVKKRSDVDFDRRLKA
jgi:RES domain-containing protein